MALAYVGYATLSEPDAQWPAAPTWWQAVGDFALDALSNFSSVAIGIAILAMLLTRPLNLTGELLMSLYQAMVNRFVIPVIEARREEGRVEGRVEGRAEGRVEGRAESDEAWREWNRRRMDAEGQGIPFDEPPPGERNDEDAC